MVCGSTLISLLLDMFRVCVRQTLFKSGTSSDIDSTLHGVLLLWLCKFSYTSLHWILKYERVQNSGAIIVTSATIYSQTTSVHKNLQWLPIN